MSQWVIVRDGAERLFVIGLAIGFLASPPGRFLLGIAALLAICWLFGGGLYR